jgi:MscS family membrane protein
LLLRIIDFASIILEKKASLTKDKSDDQIVVFFRDFLKAIISIAGLLLIIRIGFNQNISSLLTGLSIVGAALALAAKESIENLIASFIIFFDKPFITGDTLKVQSVTGTVEHIGLRSTRIRTVEKTLVTVPNKQMVDSIVDNWSMRTQRRAEIKLEFVVSTETKRIEHFISEVEKTISGHPSEIIKSSVFLTEYNKNGITIIIEYFTQPYTMSEFNKLKQAFNLALIKLIEKEKLELVSAGQDINIYGSDPGHEPAKQQPII